MPVPKLLVIIATAVHSRSASTAVLNTAAVVGTPMWAGLVSKCKAGVLFDRKMSDLELNKTLFDQDTPVAKARESLKQEYGNDWLETFEDWATHPHSLPLATAFHAAHAARTHLQRSFMETPILLYEVVVQAPCLQPGQPQVPHDRSLDETVGAGAGKTIAGGLELVSILPTFYK